MEVHVTQTEVTQLIRKVDTPRTNRGFFCTKYHKHSFCVKSKAALLVLVWNMLVGLSIGMVMNPGVYLLFRNYNGYSTSNDSFKVGQVAAIAYGTFAFCMLFYPLAGFLADVRIGRYRTIVCSLWILTLTPFTGVLAVVFPLAYAAFNANIIQFGLDQLYDSPSEHSTLFIHWFVWTQYLGVGVSQLLWSGFFCYYSSLGFLIVRSISILLLCSISFISLVGLGVSLCVGHKYRHRWFLMETGVGNPYKLVYKVVKFAAKHTRPIQRSAFTYCEDELPTRLDLGKDKYGGPFTTEQVEDVKTLFGIMIILTAASPVFMIELASNAILTILGLHTEGDWTIHECKPGKNLLINAGTLTPSLILIFIPFYVCLLRPYIGRWVPGMLNRVGIGMVLLCLSLISSFSIDTIGHKVTNSDATCMFNNPTVFIDNFTYDDKFIPLAIGLDSSVLIISNVLNAFGLMLVYIASYEFICAQSPHSMKGVLIGAFFAIKGITQLLGVVVILIPFSNINWKPQFGIPSCGFGYYLVNIVIAITGIAIYTLVSRRYQYRQRDEPSHANIHQYVEAYYSREPAEQRPPQYDDFSSSV